MDFEISEEEIYRVENPPLLPSGDYHRLWIDKYIDLHPDERWLDPQVFEDICVPRDGGKSSRGESWKWVQKHGSFGDPPDHGKTTGL